MTNRVTRNKEWSNSHVCELYTLHQLAKTLVSEIDLVWGVCKTPFLCNGIITADFHFAGIWPTDINDWNSMQIGPDIAGGIFFNRYGGYPSAPWNSFSFIFWHGRITVSGRNCILSSLVLSSTLGGKSGTLLLLLSLTCTELKTEHLCSRTWYQQSERNLSIYRDFPTRLQFGWTLVQKRLRTVGEFMTIPSPALPIFLHCATLWHVLYSGTSL